MALRRFRNVPHCDTLSSVTRNRIVKAIRRLAASERPGQWPGPRRQCGSCWRLLSAAAGSVPCQAVAGSQSASSVKAVSSHSVGEPTGMPCRSDQSVSHG